MPIGFGTQTPGNQYVQLAQMLGRQNYNNGTNAGGIATILQGLMQGYLLSKQMGAQTGANATLAAALKAGQPWKSPDPVMAGPSSTDPAQMAVNNKVLYPAGTDVPGTGGVAPMVNVLASAPPEQGLGTMAAQLQMQDMTNRQALAQKAADRAAALANQKDLYKFQQGNKAPTPGVDVPLPDSVIAQKTAIEKAKAASGLSNQMALAKYKDTLANQFPGGVTSDQATTLSGPDLLKTLPVGIATQVQKLANGQMQFPSGFALKSPYWQKMLTLTSQYDPTFDAINYNTRAKTRADFTSGQSAKQINAMNTVVGHLQSLSDAADALNNSSIPAWNRLTNFAASETGDPRIKNFDTTRKAVVDELTRVWRGMGGSEGDIKTWSQQIDAAGSPAQLHGVIGQIGDLLQSKINAMGEQYAKGMGPSSAGIQLISPKAAQTLGLLEQRAGKAPMTQPSAAAPVGAAAPTSGGIKFLGFE